MNRNELNSLGTRILECALRVHSALGPGLLESTYKACLAHELRKAGMHVQLEVPVPLVYDGVRLEVGYRLDVLVNDAIILEIKAVSGICDEHRAQLLSYLRLSGRELGYVLNFHSIRLKDGTARVINGYKSEHGVH